VPFELSVKYLHDRYLPDKAMDIIDELGQTLCSRGKKGVMVTSRDIQESVARMLKLPSTVISIDNRERLMTLADDIKGKIVGQDSAVDAVVKAIKRSYAGLNREK